MKKNFQQFKRFFSIICVSLSFIYQAFIRVQGTSGETEKRRAILLREHIEQLGSVFIKFGQFLSIYPALLPQLYCEELFYLLENVPSFPTKDVLKIFREEFYKNPEDLFQDFTLQPLAAASFGQVHKAVLKSGEKVVVKIQRPNILKIVAEDISLMKLLATFFDFFPHGPNKFTDAVEEFELWTKGELDYLTEAQLTEEYSENINKKRGDIFAPKVYKQYSSKRILTTEFIEGITLSKILLAIRNNDKELLGKLKQMGFSRKDVAMKISKDSLKQIYLKGFFHGDPHPANIIFTKNKQLAYIDFGICGRLTKKQKILCLRYARSFWTQDFESTFETLIQLCEPKIKNMERLKVDFITHLQTAHEARRRRRETGSFRNRNEFLETLKLLQKYKVKMPPSIILYYRTVIVLRNITFLLCPEIETVEIIQLLKNISLINLLTELPSLFKKEQRTMRLATLLNILENEVTKIL